MTCPECKKAIYKSIINWGKYYCRFCHKYFTGR